MTDVTAPLRAPRPPKVAERPRHLAVVDPAARRRERRARIGVRLAVAGVVAAVLVVVGFRVLMAEGQLELERLQHSAAREQQTYEALRLRYALRTAPDAIVARAKGIGMIPATSLRYLSAPGLPPGRAAADGDGTYAAARERDWKKVKPSLDKQP
jgi:hypothetical protein